MHLHCERASSCNPGHSCSFRRPSCACQGCIAHQQLLCCCMYHQTFHCLDLNDTQLLQQCGLVTVQCAWSDNAGSIQRDVPALCSQHRQSQAAYLTLEFSLSSTSLYVCIVPWVMSCRGGRLLQQRAALPARASVRAYAVAVGDKLPEAKFR